MQKPFYAVAESYKFLRHFPLSQTDLPLPKTNGQESPTPLTFPASITPFRPILQSSHSVLGPGAGAEDVSPNVPGTPVEGNGKRMFEMTKEMEDLNPLVDVTTPDLIDFIITDLGTPLSPTSVSQYLVAQFSS